MAYAVQIYKVVYRAMFVLEFSYASYDASHFERKRSFLMKIHVLWAHILGHMNVLGCSLIFTIHLV